MTNKKLLPVELPGINFALTLEQTGIPEEIFKKILLKFSEKNRAKAQEMYVLASQGDLQGLSALVHTLKGTAATIGAMPLEEACQAVEMAIEEQRGVEEIKTLIGELARALDVVVTSLASLR
ncbi:MAG: Hpt domain-containing protein [Proteobacteria bacterium]|nr:Hpt domain-containing protein [Pseudomonadota bacterium]MBU1639370.1 Hpt domain-containing protein [Pseudomonadota bacterium]